MPPFAFGRVQFQTRVLCTPVIRATDVGPPKFLMIVVAGSMMRDCSDNRDIRKRLVAKLAADDCRAPSYVRYMTKKATYRTPAAGPMNQWVRDALEHADMSQTALARELHARRVISADRSIVQKMTTTRVLSAEEVFAISEITGHPAPNEAQADLERQEVVRLLATASDEAMRVALAILRNSQPVAGGKEPPPDQKVTPLPTRPGSAR